jgi:hypothetical protein
VCSVQLTAADPRQCRRMIQESITLSRSFRRVAYRKELRDYRHEYQYFSSARFFAITHSEKWKSHAEQPRSVTSARRGGGRRLRRTPLLTGPTATDRLPAGGRCRAWAARTTPSGAEGPNPLGAAGCACGGIVRGPPRPSTPRQISANQNIWPLKSGGRAIIYPTQ